MKSCVTAVILAMLTGCATSNYDAYKNHSYYKSAHPEAYQSGQAAQPVKVTQERPQEEESNGWATAGKVLGTVAVVALGVYAIKHIAPAKAHPCVLPTDRAKDGSLCGKRASSYRPGGN